MLDSGENLLSWAEERGTKVGSGVSLSAPQDPLRGVVAACDISAGDLLFSVPMDQAITITKAISRFGGILPSSAADDGGGIYLLALELQHHILAYPDDKWVKSLPPEPQTPLEWPADSTALQALNKSPAARALLQRQIDGLEAASANLLASVREKFKGDESGGVGGDAFTEGGFKRAVSMVLSRAFQVMINDDKHLVILPVVDWLNHSDDLPPASVPVSFDRETSNFNVRAVQSYKQGDHVWITYGPKGAAELLVHYGFCVGPSKHDSAAVTVGADPANPSSSMALAMLPRALTLGGATQWVQEMKWSDQVGGKVDFPDEMILILRVSNCQMDEMMMVAMAFQGQPVSQRSDVAAFRSLEEACSEGLKGCECGAEDARRDGGANALMVAAMLDAQASIYKVGMQQAAERAEEAASGLQGGSIMGMMGGMAVADDDDDY